MAIRFRSVALCVLIVVSVIVLLQILVSFKLDVSLFSHDPGSGKYENSKRTYLSPSFAAGGSGNNLRSDTKTAVSPNVNPFGVPVLDDDLFRMSGITEAVMTEETNNLYTNFLLSQPSIISYPEEDEITQPTVDANGRVLIGGKKTALVILAYNRAQILLKTYESLVSVLDSPTNKYAVDVFISQDGENAGVSTMITNIISKASKELSGFSFEMLSHPQAKGELLTGYNNITNHVFSVLETILDKKKYEQIIVLDDDMLLAPDFFSYMSASSIILDRDSTLLAVSAWNDNSKPQFAQDPTAVYRSDSFHGGAWMVQRHFFTEVKSIWPAEFYTNWMQSETIRKGRSFLIPEVSRVITIGKEGVNSNSFFWKDQSEMIMNMNPVDFSHINLSYLSKENYDIVWKKWIDDAFIITSLDDLITIPANRNAKIFYSKQPGKNSFATIASEIGIMSDMIERIPRTAYMGVVSVNSQGIRIFLVPEGGPTTDY